MYSPRAFVAYIVLASFLTFFLSYGLTDSIQRIRSSLASDSEVSNVLGTTSNTPDFSHYEPLDTLTSKEFPLDDSKKRVIVIGDIHGMIKPFLKLLKIISYDPKSDNLIHVGDIIAKGPHKDSMAVVSYMVKHNVTGVRGNHDQMIIEWRGWINWICSSSKGCQWLQRLENQWYSQNTSSADLGSFIDSRKKEASTQDRRWWKLVPQGWDILGDHYKIAKELSNQEFQYLIDLPLRLYIPSAHVFVVHAGLLPSDPQHAYNDQKHQPLARIPKIHGKAPHSESDDVGIEGGKRGKKDIEELRNMQEIALLTQVPQNVDPWVVLNMRSIKDGKVSRKMEGKSWSKVWNKEMNRCVGFNHELSHHASRKVNSDPDLKKGKHELPCYPSTVVYGHAAARGLDLKRWTFGLDSGCIYGRRMSGIIIGGPKLNINGDDDDDDDDDDFESIDEHDEHVKLKKAETGEESHEDGHKGDEPEQEFRKPKSGDILPFGDNSNAQIVSIKCKKVRT